MNDINEDDNDLHHYQPHHEAAYHEPRYHQYREPHHDYDVDFDDDDDDDFFNDNVVNYNGHDFRFIQDWEPLLKQVSVQ